MDSLNMAQTMERLAALTQGATNLTVQVLGQESVDLVRQAYEVNPHAVLSGICFTIGTVLVALALLIRVVSLLVERRRRRQNDLLVSIAEHAPVNDDDEHEFAKHDDTRAAAPGDSDFEDDGPTQKERSCVK